MSDLQEETPKEKSLSSIEKLPAEHEALAENAIKLLADGGIDGSIAMIEYLIKQTHIEINNHGWATERNAALTQSVIALAQLREMKSQDKLAKSIRAATWAIAFLTFAYAVIALLQYLKMPDPK